MLTCDTQVCTLGSVDNKHRRNGMGTVGQNDAPYGHITVKLGINSGGMPVCDGCAFDDGMNVY